MGAPVPFHNIHCNNQRGQGQTLPATSLNKQYRFLPRAFRAPFNPAPTRDRPTVDACASTRWVIARPAPARRPPAAVDRDPAKPRLPTPARCLGCAKSVPSLCRPCRPPRCARRAARAGAPRDPPGKHPQQPPACLQAVRGTAGAKRGSGSRRAFQHTDQSGMSLAGGPRCTEPPQIVRLPR